MVAATASANAQAPALGVGPPVIRANVESSAKNYKVGSPVLIQIALTNISSRPYSYTTLAPWHIVQLKICDAAGKLVVPAHSVSTADAMRGYAYIFEPGETRILYFDRSSKGNSWEDLSNWGYSLTPGRYTITAAPKGDVVEIDPATTTSDDPKSLNRFMLPPAFGNTISVTITP